MIVNVRDFVSQWGYLGLFCASMIESEPVLICMSFLSKSLAFNVFLIFFLSVLGTFFGSTLFFVLGRRFSLYFESFGMVKKNLKKIDDLINKYGLAFIVSFRFIYGIKLVSPIILGFSKISFNEFVIANCIGSIIWSFLMIVLGVVLSLYVKTFSVKLIFYIYIFTLIVPFIFAFIYMFLKRLLKKMKG